MSEEQLIATPGVFGENGNFLLERELGRGGMGGVYMGRDKMLDRPIALKVMLRQYGEDPAFVEKFKREAQAAARLIHPNIAQIYSYGISDGMPYIAMELVAGGSLDQLMKTRGKDIDVPRVMKICEQVAQALRCAADQGLVHGDVKPENVLLDANGNAKLVDFGLAAMQKDTTEIWGTPYYIAPEKVRKQEVDYRADMYSLGGTIYHALTGVAPFEGADATEVVRKRFEGMPVPPSHVRPGLSPQIDELVMKMLALDPQDRYPSFEALIEAFKQVLTTGLTLVSPAEPSTGAARKQTGSKKIVLKGKRRMTVRRPTDLTAPSEEEGAEKSEESSEETPSKPMSLRERRRQMMMERAGDQDDDDEEKGVAGKALMTVGGVILAIVLIVGGLIWYTVADKKSRERERQAQISAGIRTVMAAIQDARPKTEKFIQMYSDTVKETAASAEKTTQAVADAMSGMYDEEAIALLRLPKTKVLLDAEASTNVVVEAAAPASTNGAPQAAGSVSNAVEQVAGAMTNALAQAVGEMANALAQVVGERTNALAQAAPQESAQAGQDASSEPEKKIEIPLFVTTVQDLWEKTYAAQAALIYLQKSAEELYAYLETAEKVVGQDEAAMRQLEEISNKASSMFTSMNESEYKTTIQKSHGSVLGKAKKLIETALRDVRVKKAEAERAKQKEEAEKRKTELEAEKEAARKAKIEKEIAAAKACSESLLLTAVRQLDWKGAKRQLNDLKTDVTDPIETAEGQIQLDKELKKIEMMETVTTIFKRNLKGYTFKARGKSPLSGRKVVDTKDTEFVIAVKGGATRRIQWVNLFVKEAYVPSLNEIINRYIVHGRENGSSRLTAKEQANAYFGMAMLLRTLCSANATAVTFATDLVGRGLRVMSDEYYLSLAKEFFPDLDFEKIQKEIESEKL